MELQRIESEEVESMCQGEENIPQQAEPEVMLPSLIIGPKHQDISEDFLAKVRGLISGSVRLKVMDYGVKRARGSWDSNDETLSLEIDDNSGRKLIIKIETKGE